MYRAAPRCSEPLLPRSTWADSISMLPPAAETEPEIRTAAAIRPRKNETGLVMVGNPGWHFFGLAHGRPNWHGEEEGEIEHGQDARGPGLHRAAGLHAE